MATDCILPNFCLCLANSWRWLRGDMDYYNPPPINQAGRQATSTQQASKQALHGCVLSVAAALAPAQAPNFGGGLPLWCPSLSPVSGLEPCAVGSLYPRHQRWVTPPEKKQGPIGLQNSPEWPQTASGGPPPRSITLCDQPNTRSAALGQYRTPLRTSYRPFSPVSGPLWPQIHAHGVETKKMAVSWAGRPKT